MSAGARPMSDCPAKLIEPEATGTRPMMALQSVVLPMPLRPTTDSTPPLRLRSTPCSACDAP